MDIPSIMMVGALVVLLILSAFFSATETAFSCVNKIRLKSWADNDEGKRGRRAKRCLALAEDYDKLLTTILIGNNIVNIASTTVATVFFTGVIGEAGPATATVVMTLLVLTFGEVTPKSIAKERAEGFAMFATPIMRVLVKLFTPLAFLFGVLKSWMAKLFKAPAEEGITDEELTAMVTQAEDEGGLDSHESQLIRAAIEFDDLEVGEILTPRVDIEGVEDTAGADEIAARFAETGYSRLPVYHETIDSIVGVIHEKDFYAARSRGLTDLSSLVKEVICTTSNTKISDLMRVLQANKNHMAVIVDEYGGTEGIVTLEDILEELVGDIWDEADEVEPDVTEMGEHEFLLDGDMNIYDAFESVGYEPDEEFDSEYNTLGGWVTEMLDRFPQPGDTFTHDGLQVTVMSVDEHRVEQVKIVVDQPEDEKEE